MLTFPEKLDKDMEDALKSDKKELVTIKAVTNMRSYGVTESPDTDPAFALTQLG